MAKAPIELLDDEDSDDNKPV